MPAEDTPSMQLTDRGGQCDRHPNCNPQHHHHITTTVAANMVVIPVIINDLSTTLSTSLLSL